MAAVGSSSKVSRSDRSTTVALSRRKPNLSHRAYTAVTPLRVCASTRSTRQGAGGRTGPARADARC